LKPDVRGQRWVQPFSLLTSHFSHHLSPLVALRNRTDSHFAKKLPACMLRLALLGCNVPQAHV